MVNGARRRRPRRVRRRCHPARAPASRSTPSLPTAARPGGTILDQRPGQREEARSRARRSRLTVSEHRAEVPDVITMDVERRQGRAARSEGFAQPHGHPRLPRRRRRRHGDEHQPARANLQADKSDRLELVVAADPHVKVPDVVGVDQAHRHRRAPGRSGSMVAVQTASSSTAAGRHGDRRRARAPTTTVVRGDTITLTVSSGPKQVNVAHRVGETGDDAIDELEDARLRGAACVTRGRRRATTRSTPCVAQDPAGGPGRRGLDHHHHRRGAKKSAEAPEYFATLISDAKLLRRDHPAPPPSARRAPTSPSWRRSCAWRWPGSSRRIRQQAAITGEELTASTPGRAGHHRAARARSPSASSPRSSRCSRRA